jgi:hypothetical protein
VASFNGAIGTITRELFLEVRAEEVFKEQNLRDKKLTATGSSSGADLEVDIWIEAENNFHKKPKRLQGLEQPSLVIVRV